MKNHNLGAALTFSVEQIQLDDHARNDGLLAHHPNGINTIHPIQMMNLNQIHTQMAPPPGLLSCHEPLHRLSLPILLGQERNGTTLPCMPPLQSTTSMERAT